MRTGNGSSPLRPRGLPCHTSARPSSRPESCPCRCRCQPSIACRAPGQSGPPEFWATWRAGDKRGHVLTRRQEATSSRENKVRPAALWESICGTTVTWTMRESPRTSSPCQHHCRSDFLSLISGVVIKMADIRA